MDQKNSTINNKLIYLLNILNAKNDEEMVNDLAHFSVSDWKEFIYISNIHGVASILYKNLKKSNLINFLSKENIDNLQNLYLRNAILNTKIYNELLKIIKIFQDNNIQVVLLKGVALAEPIYKDIALRPMSDMDLLVRKCDIWFVNDVLSKLGYESDIDRLLSKRHVQWANNIHYFNNMLSLDIHHTIYMLPGIDPWINIKSTKIYNIDTFILEPNAFFLHLSFHLNNHFRNDRWIRLIWWYDIAKLLSVYQKEFNWDYILKTAKDYQFEKELNIILLTINDKLNVQIPDQILDQIKKINTKPLSINKLVYYNKVPMQPNDRIIGLPTVELSRIPNIHNKLYHIFRIVFPCKNYIKNVYLVNKSNLLYLYYIKHIVKTTAKFIKAILFLHKQRYSFSNLSNEI